MKKLILQLLFIPLVFSCEKDPVLYMLTTSANPVEGGTVLPATRQYESGDTANLVAAPAAEYVFESWTGVTGTEETTVVMDADKTVVANFVKKKYPLTIKIEGEGTVEEKIIKAGASTDYNSGTIVELTANCTAAWKFKEWKGELTGTENPKQITIDKPKTVTAVFESIPPFYLDTNGETIKANDWVTAGTTGDLNGVTYTAVNINQLKTMFTKEEDVSKVVTTLITDMSKLFINAPVTLDYDVCDFCPPDNIILFDPDISSWDVSNVTNMAEMFGTENSNSVKRWFKFNQDISSWDVSKVTDMSNMFSGGKIFNQDISKWDISNVTDMRDMFSWALQFNKDIGSWDVSKVTDMSSMFKHANSFNQDITSWDVSKVTDMSYMFSGTILFNQDISSWDISKVTNMSWMLAHCEDFNQDIGKWDVSNVTDMSGMFIGHYDNFIGDITKWDVSKVTDMNYMFSSARIFNQDIGSWDVSNVTNMSHMFHIATAFNQDIGSWDVSNVT